MSTFGQYATPLPSARYSSEFFDRLTFQEAKDLSYPYIAPAGTFTEFVFLDGVPSAATALNVLDNEIIPCLADLLPISSVMPGQYDDGKRSVGIMTQIGLGGDAVYRICHFSKVCVNFI